MTAMARNEPFAGLPRHHSAAATAEALEFQWNRSRSEIAALEEEWLALEAMCPDTVLFQSLAWCRNFMDFAADGSVEPLVLTIRNNGALIALMPLSIRKNAGMKLLTGLSEPFQQYSEMLVHPQAELSLVRASLVAALRATDADCLHLRQVRLDGALAGVLAGTASSVGTADCAPYVDLAGHADFTSFFKTVNSKTRKNMRNARNRLAKTGEVKHVHGQSSDFVAGVIEWCFLGRKAWLSKHGMTSRAFGDDRFERFASRFRQSEKTGIATLAMSLRHGERAISDQWGFVYRGRYYAFMASFDPEYEISSPGKLHLGDVIETCFANRLSVADFLVPGTGYKFTWTADATPVSDLAVAASWKGRIILSLWFKRGRPTAKRLFLKLPERPRSHLLRMLRR